MGKITLSVDSEALEVLIRRIVRQELRRLAGQAAPPRQELEDAGHEGPEDLAGDERLLQQALEVLEKHPEGAGWVDWDAFQIELERAESAGELPD